MFFNFVDQSSSIQNACPKTIGSQWPPHIYLGQTFDKASLTIIGPLIGLKSLFRARCMHAHAISVNVREYIYMLERVRIGAYIYLVCGKKISHQFAFRHQRFVQSLI